MSLSRTISILEQLRGEGTEISLDGDTLLVRGHVPLALAAQIRDNKAGIVAFLASLGPQEEKAAPVIVPDPARRHDPFPLNETQQAYWLGRDAVFESGEVAIHVYIELGGGALDLARLETAWRLLVAHHDMLRAIVLADGRQQVLESPPVWSMPVHDLRALSQEAALERVGACREQLSHYCADLARWPSWKLEGFQLPDGENLLMLSLDCWSIDGRSIQILAADLAALYHHSDSALPVTELTFRDYVLGLEAEQHTAAYERALDYWQQRVRILPPAPQLPRRRGAADAKVRFVRHHQTHSQAVYTQLRQQAAAHGLTVASVLIACYAQVLGRWSDASRFTLNIPRWNRHPLHGDVDQILGEFATFELLEVELRRGESFAGFAKRLQARFAEDLNHDIVSGVRILREWRKFHGADPGVAMPFVFTHEPDLFGEGRARAYMASFSDIAPVRAALTQTPQVWIDAQYHDVNGALYLVWDALDDLFAEGTIAAMFDAYTQLVEELGTDERRWTDGEAAVALPARQQVARTRFNDTRTRFPPLLFHERLDWHAAQTPDALAVADCFGELSWAELRRHVDALAGRLTDSGLGTGVPVAVMMEKGAGQMIAALALHCVGAIAVPVDPETPSERMAYMVDHCRAAAVLTTPAMAETVQDKLAGGRVPMLFVDRRQPLTACAEAGRVTLNDEDLHCILYTSGTTGLPKAVMVPLGAVKNVVADGLPRFDIGPGSRFLSLTPQHHDLSLFDIYAATCAGGAVVFPDPAGLRDPAHWLTLMQQYGVTVWNSVPAMMTMLLDYCGGADASIAAEPDRVVKTMRTVILGGDWIPPETPVRLPAFAPSALLTSIGGPTETTIWNISYPVTGIPEGWSSIPYGTPTANNRTYILNERFEDCPDWVAGDMYCAGAGVTAGYLGDRLRTDAAFIPHPRTGERLYHTGDRGCFRPEGIIEFLGRRDSQVNLNGYRLELGELDAALGRHKDVAQAVAVALRDGNSVRGLVVWVSLHKGADVTATVLMDFIKSVLPRQMHPSAIRLCDAFPLTANGKVDRARLAGEADTGGAVAAVFEPEDELEAEVADAWRATLGAAPAAADISFFAAGGDSISAIRLYNRLLAGRVEGATVLTVFRAPTIRALSALLRDSEGRRNAGAALPPVIATPRDDVCYPATAAQSRLWFEERVTGEGSLYNLCFNVQVTGTVDVAVLEAAFDRIIAAWEILRIAIREDEDGEPVQVLQAPWAFRMQVTDLRSDADKHNRLKALGRAEAETPFVLAEGRPVRAHLVRLSEQSANLVITVHHTAFDGWTFGHFLEVLAASLQGAEIRRPEISSIDYARWEQLAAVEETVARQTEWWHSHLAETPPGAELSPGLLRAPIRESEGAICSRTLPPDLVAGLTSLSRSADTTPFVTLLAALGVVLGRLTGEDRVLLGTHISLRNQPVLETTPGMMVNNICLKLETGRNAGFVSVLNAAREAVLGGLEHGLAPFNHVVRRMGNWHDTTRHPLYNMTFTHENFSNAVLSAGDLTLSHADPFVARSPLDIDLAMADPTDGGISLKAVFNTGLFSDEFIAALLEATEAVLVTVIEDEERPLQDIVLALTPLEVLLERGEGPHMVVPDRSGIRLFEERVAAAPQDPALLDEAGRTILSFGELGNRVACAAAHFTANGLQAGDTLAICLPRSENLVTAMLAAWRCGAHFTAMSAGLPEARIRAIADDARPQLFVTDRPELAGDVRVSDPGSWLSDVQTGPHADVSKTAALIYTSGSTGVPNGVEFTMAALLNRLHWQWRHYPFAPGERCVARTAVDFVDYLAEILGPLLAGYPVAVLSDATVGDPAALLAAVGSVRPRRLLMIPSLMDVLLEDTAVAPAQLASIRLWISSGEPLEKRVADRLHGLLPGSTLLNLYGSSETGADVTAAEVVAGADRIGIGSPIANLGTHIVDSAGQPLPAGLPGSILVSGAGLARGYRNREQLNAQRFIQWHGRRVFCTGDRGIRMADGTIRLLGRSDRQVKIRGQRIELGDVQAVISAVPGVESAAVVLDTGQDRPEILAAFSGTAGQDQVMHALTRLLPPAARPAQCVRLEALPRTSGGKLAYGAVADLVRAADAGDRADVLPLVTDTEKRLAVLWQDVLGEKVLSRSTLFHSVGGHSLAAARLAARVTRDFQIACPVRLVIERSELGDMAAAIDDLAASAMAQTEEFIF